MPPSVLLYRYDSSPFSVKIDNILLLKNIQHQKVNVSLVLPRPEITEFLGISYRRIPILAIGNDVYCDTSLISSALERRFPTSHGYGTIFPPRKHGGGIDTGLLKAFSQFYADNMLFTLASILLPWEKFSPSFIQDRNLLFGTPINVRMIEASRGKTASILSSHLSLLEEQLQDGREWLFDTELPGLADLSVHFIFAWMKSFRSAQSLFHAQQFPNVLEWLTRMSNFLDGKKTDRAIDIQETTGAEAAACIVSSTFEPYNVVGFDTTEAARLQLKAGESVQIAPDDTGTNFPTVGKLVALSKEEVVIQVHGSKGTIRCHFPRLGFSVKGVTKNKL